MTKPLVIYHKNCADGFGAAWAAYKRFGEEGAEYLPMGYNDPRVKLTSTGFEFPAELEGRDVYILDFSFKPDITEAIFNTASFLFWRDHHKTAFEDNGHDPNEAWGYVSGKADILLDPHKSGCVLAWELIHPEKPTPTFLRLIQDRDLWKWEMNGTRDFAVSLRSKELSFKNFDYANDCFALMIKEGEAMNKLFDQQLIDITARPLVTSLFTDVGGAAGLSVNCTSQFASEAGNILAQKSGTFGMTWCMGEQGIVFVALRSVGDYDVTKIARVYGGGGHKNAAGFKTHISCFNFDAEGQLFLTKE